jgi:sulfite reductase (NADPH) flavoprotein alpha-component
VSTTAFPLIPDNAPFTPEQRAWLNGFLAGMFSRTHVAPAAPTPAPATTPLTILFGSQTGTAESLAKKVSKEAARRGFAPTVADMGSFDAAKLAAAQNVLVITSTYGDGEPPDSAKALHGALAAASGPSLAGVRYSVCALGDTNYTKFCQCGKDFDAFLEKHGATRVHARVDCDLDYEAAFARWLDAALAALAPAPAPAEAHKAKAENVVEAETEPIYSKKNPFSAPVLAVRKLNGAGSTKEVNHIEFSLDGSDLTYEVGDALGVYPQNCPALVDEVIRALGCDGEEAVATPAGELPLRTALTLHFDLGRPSQELLKLLAPHHYHAAEAGTATAVVPILHVIDLLLAAEVKPKLADFVAALKKIQPRLYSISSSPKAHPGQVHLTVGAVRYEVQGRRRKGACSTFLAERALTAGRAGVFVHRNTNFRLPENDDAPVIMVGPGTGIAPFRAFLQERRARGAKGRNWLFFGDQHAASDFLYREELEAMHRDNHLTRLDLAWSRDQAEKIYVQQRMLANAAELYAWLEAGAYFYVCGDASRMASDVDRALRAVVETAGGKTASQAEDYVASLKTAKRYQRDVY